MIKDFKAFGEQKNVYGKVKYATLLSLVDNADGIPTHTHTHPRKLDTIVQYRSQKFIILIFLLHFCVLQKNSQIK